MPIPTTLVPALSRALEKRGYDALTPVQDAMLESGLEGSDLIVSAQTGSGKTVAFGLALASDILDEDGRFGPAGSPLALVIAPTRELALQVQRELSWLYEFSGGRVVACVGGMDARDERRALERGAHIVVGTPGRLSDHIRRNALDMTGLAAVVLDEADEMLNLGFREELEFILDASPDDRRTLMFSATMPKAIEALAKTYQRDAMRVNTINRAVQHGDIDYRALTVAGHDEENAIFNVLRYHDAPNAIVFCGTRAAVNRLTSRFTNRGISVVALSGELTQAERSHALQAMREGRARVCVATDVAARGIDLPDLELVIHADLPRNPEALLHRSGRTGRAGRKGASILIVPVKARRRVERLLADARIEAEWGRPPSADQVRERDNERLLAESIFTETVAENEAKLAASLLETHGAEAVAAAFVRLYRKGQAAPEDLAQPPETGQRAPRERRERPERDAPRRPREDFADGVWIELSVGRKQSAEPRWLLPLLCNRGGVTRRDIGAIRINDLTTHVELSADAAEAFLAAIGPEGTLEKSVRLRRLDGQPPAQSSTPVHSHDGPDRRPPRAPRSKPEQRAEQWSDGGPPRPKRDRPPAASESAADSPPEKRAISAKPKPKPYAKSRQTAGDRPPGKGGPGKGPAGKKKFRKRDAEGASPPRKTSRPGKPGWTPHDSDA